MRRVGGQGTVSCTGQFIGSAQIAVLLEAITKGYGVFLRTLTQSHTYEYGMAKGLQRLAATDIRII